LLKPFGLSEIGTLPDRLARIRRLRDRLADAEERVRAEVPEAEFDSPDPQVQRALECARRVAPSGATVLIRGEIGLSELSGRIIRGAAAAEVAIEVGRPVSLRILEAEHIRCIQDTTANLDQACRVLAIDPSTLYRKRKRMGI
jgi:DNA-binding NtrC family response regulator